MFDHVELTNERPIEKGYYFVKWSENEEKLLLWIDYLVKDGTEFWLWRYTTNDDANDVHFDAQNPDYPQFSDRIPTSDE
ncbi:hypothetical protein EG347_02440 [Chryseobacterium sp. G0186]|uniref:hypothetical protein n=1 Tax=Chryseobacterium sp. G0186 TaxID=2487064 RepID=UPI000F4D7010|nr:hypothetical protein [Chryseobacterium sp. G0186]AZA76461.1 hypothetical protein EG347_02440 [Chryseobacterium sp. G0186]